MFPYSARKQVIRLVRKRIENAARKRLQANEGLWSLLQAYLEKTESTGCQYTDYDVLYRYIRESKPREILECGTGVSTLVVAYALRENAARDGIESRLTSMEEREFWFEMAVRLLPDELRDYTEIRLSPKVEDGYTIFRGLRYAELPERLYDFIFTDGPSTLAPSDGTRSFDFDYLHVVRHADHPVFGVVDGRLTTCYVLQKVFGPEKIRFDVYRDLGYVGPCTRRDMRTIARSSSIALAHSKRLLRPTRFHLVMEPPDAPDQSQ
jgi:predicted O-methyltransferase YrrM